MNTRAKTTRAVRRPGSTVVTILLALVLVAASVVLPGSTVLAQDVLDCDPAASATAVDLPDEMPEVSGPEVPEDAIDVTMGYMPVSIFAPVFIAYEKGYFADQGLNVELESLGSGSDMVLLTATGEFDLGIGGIGPAYWNAVSQDLPVSIIAPGHEEAETVASPLMISREACEEGRYTNAADLEGQRVSVNSQGATELWLDIALETGGIDINDIDLQFLQFPDAVLALESGAIDGAIVGEPVATQAELDGLAVRLVSEMPVEGIQPTMVFANDNWLADNPDAAAGMIAGYLQGALDLTENFNDPLNLAIIEEYTGVPPELVAASVQPVYAVDGEVNVESLDQLQTFFRERDLLDYPDDIDTGTMVDTNVVEDALDLLEDE